MIESGSSWLAEISTETFRRDYFRRQPLARPLSAQPAVPFLSWQTVGSLVAFQPPPDLLIVRNGKLLDGVRPTSLDEVKTLFAKGCSVVIRRCERHDVPLQSIANAFSRMLEGDVSIQVYATPAGFHSFTWHYDCEDVFIAQTAGTKEYYLRENTVNPRPTLDDMPRDMQYEKETTPTVGTTLVAGDWLYIPRGWWHVARGIEDALSISVGVLGPDAARRRDVIAPNA